MELTLPHACPEHRPELAARGNIPDAEGWLVTTAARAAATARARRLHRSSSRRWPVIATVDSSLTVSTWPCGQGVGAFASLIGRTCSKLPPQVRHRYS